MHHQPLPLTFAAWIASLWFCMIAVLGNVLAQAAFMFSNKLTGNLCLNSPSRCFNESRTREPSSCGEETSFIVEALLAGPSHGSAFNFRYSSFSTFLLSINYHQSNFMAPSLSCSETMELGGNENQRLRDSHRRPRHLTAPF